MQRFLTSRISIEDAGKSIETLTRSLRSLNSRKQGTNSDVPEWLSRDYFSAIQELANIGTREIRTADAPETVRAILSMIAIAKGLPIHANFLLKYSEDEMLEFEAHL